MNRPARHVPAVVVAPTEHALRNLHFLAMLAGADLLDFLPHTVGAALTEQQVPPQEWRHRLARARALRSILIAAIDRFKLGESAGRRSLHHQILLLEYVQGRPNDQIQTLLDISPATFYRHRQRAVKALAAELVQREALLVRAAEQSVAQA